MYVVNAVLWVYFLRCEIIRGPADFGLSALGVCAFLFSERKKKIYFRRETV